MAGQWYDSKAAILLVIGLGLAAILKTCGETSVNTPDIESVVRDYQIQTLDLNGNGIPEKFYMIDNHFAVVELDGTPVIGQYKTNSGME